VVWLPTIVLVPLSWTAIVLQKILRPGKPALNVAKTFARQRYDYSLIARLAAQIDAATPATQHASVDQIAEPGLTVGSR